tara:strand:+ start:27 stop:524 length:498 start_codon:yes stop_codon:yes gene_type:complete
MALIKLNNQSFGSGAIDNTNLPSGSVLQVVTNTISTLYGGTAGGEVYTNVSGSITPSFSSSKILVLFDGQISQTGTKNNFATRWRIRRGTSTSDTSLTHQRNGHYHGGSITAEKHASLGFNYLDSPSSTSQVTYGLFVSNIDGAPNWTINDNGSTSIFTLIEIQG